VSSKECKTTNRTKTENSQGRKTIIHDFEGDNAYTRTFIFFILVVFSTSFSILAVDKLKKLNMIV
jgi:hypothetical protein